MPMEYPPLSWYVASVTGWLTDVASGGAASSSRLDDLDDLASQPGVRGETWLYFGMNLVLLAGATAWTASILNRFITSRVRVLAWFVARASCWPEPSTGTSSLSRRWPHRFWPGTGGCPSGQDSSSGSALP